MAMRSNTVKVIAILQKLELLQIVKTIIFHGTAQNLILKRILLKDQLVLDDDKDTASIIELKRLEDSAVSGIEYGFSWNGKWDDRSNYEFKGEFLTPIGEDIKAGEECADCSDMELTNVNVLLSFTTKLNDWANLKYEYKAIKQPKTLNEFQIQHGLVFGG